MQRPRSTSAGRTSHAGRCGTLPAVREPNWRSMRAQWRRVARDVGLLGGIRVWRGEDGKTWVHVEMTQPHLSRHGRPRYLLTTRQQLLDPTGFPDQGLRQNLAHDARKAQRRALYCWDLRHDLTLAALSFHVDRKPSIPLVVTDLALRQDELGAHSIFAGWMLLDVLQDIAVAAPNRADHEIGALAGDDTQRARLERFGVRPCARPAHLDKPGTWYCYPRTRAKSN